MDENEARNGLEVGQFLKIVDDDILLEIFLRLPDFYSVVDCRHVCRRWERVIDHPKFSHMFQRRLYGSASPILFTLLLGRSGLDRWLQLTGTRLIISVNLSSSTALLRRLYHNHIVSVPWFKSFLFHLHHNGTNYLDFLPRWQDSLVRASCNDLLLLQFPSEQLWCICNPMTRRWLWLPPPRSPNFHFQTCALACDPTSGRGYRVVLFKENSVSVYNSVTQEWVEDLPHPPRPEERLRSVDWKVATRGGVVYTSLEDFRHKYVLKKIVAFDPFDPSGGTQSVGLPSGFVGGWRATNRRTRTWVVRGRLRLWQAYWDKMKNGGSFIFRLWELKLHPHEWVTLQDLELKSEGDTFMPKSLVFALHPEDDYTFYVRDDRPFLWQYHIRSRKRLQINCDISSFTRPCNQVFPLVHPPWPTDVY